MNWGTDKLTNVIAKLFNVAGDQINPATEDKQDDTISELEKTTAGVEASTDLEGRGKISVGTTAVELDFTGTPTKAIKISAATDNTGILYIGKSDVDSTGANAIDFLENGDSIEIDYNDADNAVYVVSDTASQNYFSGALL